jgi:hypothetical protein
MPAMSPVIGIAVPDIGTTSALAGIAVAKATIRTINMRMTERAMP